MIRDNVVEVISRADWPCLEILCLSLFVNDADENLITSKGLKGLVKTRFPKLIKFSIGRS